MTICCPACQKRYRIDPGGAGKATVRVKCPACDHVFKVNLAPKSVQTASGKVLVVDDARFFRELIVDLLQPLSLEVLTAADGDEALETIRRERPALVILDLNIPGRDGYELIREVRRDPSLAGTRLLAMSGVFRKEADVDKVRKAGADDFINKSFKPEGLQERVRRLLGT